MANLETTLQLKVKTDNCFKELQMTEGEVIREKGRIEVKGKGINIQFMAMLEEDEE